MNGQIPAPSRGTNPVTVSHVDQATWDAALEMADGDATRLKASADGSITVLNVPRGGRRLERPR